MKLKRGMRVDSGGYRGTIVEIGIIPHCTRACECGATGALEVPGALIYWDHMTNHNGDPIYPESLSGIESHEANKGRSESFQWLDLSRVKDLIGKKRKK